jgi:hypothetical protein
VGPQAPRLDSDPRTPSPLKHDRVNGFKDSGKHDRVNGFKDLGPGASLKGC